MGQSVANKIIAEYITSRHLTTPEQCRDAVIQIRTDFDFIAHSVTRSGHAKQYLYEFTYHATHTNRPAWAGVTHASELPFVFGQPFVNDQFFAHVFPYSWSPQDKTVSSNMITLWTNFVKYGNPTPQSVGGVNWPPFSLDSQSYLDIGSSLSAKVDLAGERVRFWDTILN
ncbi:bile salt-activated lipase-like [Littorina saxatilis]|uniref:bile salt-activated lipase-like n=1 Tax=Littorina saxatilis TaxID=31220 RepID=UPI0038B423CD